MDNTSPHPVVSRQDWLIARRALLADEKTFTKARDALSARRRALPYVAIDKDYRFAGEQGEQSLVDLFAGRRQLIVYHFMYGLTYAEGCPSCSFWADNFDGILPHLAARDTTLVCISKAPLDQLLAYRKRMGWHFNWVSAGTSGFNEDFGVSFTPDVGGGDYNFGPRTSTMAEYPGISTFLRQGERVLHSYSTYARGLDMVNGAYHLLDLSPLGRQEEGLPFTMSWLRRHDRYKRQTPNG